MINSITFSSSGVQKSLTCDESFILIKKAAYRDTSEDEVKQIIREIEAGQNWRDVIAHHFKNSHRWLFDVITYQKRDLFFGQFCQPHGAVALDIGSGWGQIALPLAKNNQVCVVEPTPERFDFIRAVARQEGIAQNMFFINADYMQISFATRFDLITCIGVLEWVGAFSDETDAQFVQRNFLKKIRSELQMGGQCVIGIENRVGLKYLLGAPDDHLGVPGISLFDADLAQHKWFELTHEPLRIFTYTMEEYRSLLLEAGFETIKFYASFPDYKLPQVILSADEPHPVNQFFIEGHYIAEHNGTTGSLLPNQGELKSLYRSLSGLGIAQYFAPSYFILAS
jgi:2-polyprenyl-3-methyl-5-hydroxy-6-metoxy-1,4-benzoquinol methylase